MFKLEGYVKNVSILKYDAATTCRRMSNTISPSLKKTRANRKLFFKICQTLNMLIDNVLVLFVGLDLLDEEFQSAAVSLEQHNSHARTRHPRRDWLRWGERSPGAVPAWAPTLGSHWSGGGLFPPPPPQLARRDAPPIVVNNDEKSATLLGWIGSGRSFQPLLSLYQSSAIWGSLLPQQFRRDKPTLVSDGVLVMLIQLIN